MSAMLDPRTHLSSVAVALICLSALALAGCPTPVVHHSTADELARTIFRVAKEGDASEWGTLLTNARRAQGRAYIRDHFDKWHRLVLEIEQSAFGGNLAIAQFRVEQGALEFHSEDKWVHLFRVEMEDGGWKINQD